MMNRHRHRERNSSSKTCYRNERKEIGRKTQKKQRNNFDQKLAKRTKHTQQ